MSKKKYYIVSEDALPDIFIKVAEAKRKAAEKAGAAEKGEHRPVMGQPVGGRQ